MAVKWYFLLLFSWFGTDLYGQVTDYLIKEEREAIYAGETGPTSLINSNNSFYTYNARGLLHQLKIESCFIEGKLTCNTERKEFYTYDALKRRKTRIDHIFDPSGTIKTVINYEYDYHGISDQLKKYAFELQSLSDGDVSSFTMNYDEQGRLISEFYQRTDANGNQSTTETRAEYDSFGCVVFFEVEQYYDIIGSERYSFLRVENTYIEECLEESVKTYEYNPDLNSIELKSIIQWEYDKDTRGNISKISQFQNNAPWDSTLFLYSTTTIFYDEFNRDTLRVEFIDNQSSGRRDKTYYDVADRKIYQLFERWDGNSNQWIPVEEKSTAYNENDLLSLVLTKSNFDTSLQGYFYMEEYRIEYNADGQPIYEYAQIDDLNPDYPYRETYETLTEYACDGRFVKSEQAQETNNNTRIITRAYFDRPLCDPTSHEKLKLLALPNPANQVVHVQTDQVIQQGVLSVYNENGQLLLSKVVGKGSFFSLDVSAFIPGVYILRLETAEKVGLVKLVKGVLN